MSTLEKLKECEANERCDCGGTDVLRVNFGSSGQFSLICQKCGQEPTFTRRARRRGAEVSNLLDVLQAIEDISGDDWCEELSCEGGFKRLRGRIAVANDKLEHIYRLAHSFNTQHSCHHVHDNWRKELAERGPGEETEP